MAVPPVETCSNCTAWIPMEGGIVGYCQAHPPVPRFGAHINQPGSGVPELIYAFPETAADEWCREHIRTPGPTTDADA